MQQPQYVIHQSVDCTSSEERERERERVLYVRLLLDYRSSNAMYYVKYFLKWNISRLGKTAELIEEAEVAAQDCSFWRILTSQAASADRHDTD